MGNSGQIRTVEMRATWRGILFGGEGDDEYRLSSMMWADSYWSFRDDRNLDSMVSNIIHELMDPDMEPRPESLWWRSTYNSEVLVTVEVFDMSEYRLQRNGRRVFKKRNGV